MKVLAAVITVTALGVIVALNRDDIIRYLKMRQM